MTHDRRTFLQTMMGGGLAATTLSGITFADQTQTPPGIKAVAFDAFPVFDPRPIAALAESLFTGNGTALMNAWRIRQFEYQWLRALAGQYTDFMQTTLSSMRFAADQLKLDLTAEKQEKLMAAWSDLKVWPDAAESLKKLRESGYRLVFLSNMTSKMLTDGLQKAGIEDLFESIISTDRIRSYKPDPKAYKLGTDQLKLKKEEILFVAFAGWDVAGAKWFGYPTYWVNRLNSPAEELGAMADRTGRDLTDLTKFLLTA